VSTSNARSRNLSEQPTLSTRIQSGVVSINRSSLEVGALEGMCKKNCRGCRISGSFSALPDVNSCSAVTELQFPNNQCNGAHSVIMALSGKLERFIFVTH